MTLFKGVRITDTYFTGHKTAVLPTLTRSISAICREDRGVSLFYIGIASGWDHEAALKRRIDDKKIFFGTTDMYLLYQSTSETNTKEIESYLVDRFKDEKADLRVWNSARGGGGRPGSGPFFFLYLALTRATINAA